MDHMLGISDNNPINAILIDMDGAKANQQSTQDNTNWSNVYLPV